MTKKILWIGDAVMATGFAKCTHAACDALDAAGHEVHVLGLNYDGDPQSYPYAIYPAGRAFRQEDPFGIARIPEMLRRQQFDAVVLLNDPWNIPRYMQTIRKWDEHVPVVGYVAVDGKNCRGDALNDLSRVIFWTHFAENEARLGGFTGRGDVVPLGVDTTIFKKMSKSRAREVMLPPRLQSSFLIGAIGRNQPRKRLDLTVAYYADWVHSRGIEDAVLLLHVAPTGDQGWDLKKLGQFYKLTGKMLICTPEIGHGITEEELALTYATLDLCVTTTQGEGWGLCTMEAMACGVPCIVPAWSALGEWCEGAPRYVSCSTIAHTPNNINVMGGIPDRAEFIKALDDLYLDIAEREAMSERGLELTQRDCFRWTDIGQRVASIVMEAAEAGAIAAQEREAKRAAEVAAEAVDDITDKAVTKAAEHPQEAAVSASS